MVKLSKVKIASLRDAMNLLPDSVISSNGELLLMCGEVNKGVCDKSFFNKTYLVEIRATGNNLIIGEYLTNKFVYGNRMQYVPNCLCTVIKEWELQE